LLQRSIDFDPFELTIEEKIFRSLKRLCVIFAAGAMTLCLLDLTNIRSVDAAVEFLHDSSTRIVELPNRVVELPDRIRSEIRNISILPTTLPVSLSAQATASVPHSQPAPVVAPAIVVASAPAGPAALPATEHAATSLVAVHAAASPIAELAAARHQDAIELAMAPPPLPTIPSPPPAPAQPAVMAKADSQSAAAAKFDLPASLEQAPAAPNLTPMLFAAADADLPSATSIAPTPVSLPMSSAIPLDMVPIPRAAPGLPPPSPAQRLHLEGTDYAKAERCLANAVYFESRSEPVRGQMAVAQVVMNRVFSGFYPNDICGVVYQNADRHLACQFTFACDGKRKLINERGAWARANRIAKETLDGLIYVPEVAKSTHYHAVYVHPNWVREMHKLVRYGIHNFYRPIAWGNGADEPVWGSAAIALNKKK
jgi:hypothetical protein